MCLAEILEKVENKDINVRFYITIYINNGKTCESVEFMIRDYDITSIPKLLLLAIYNECEITNDLIRIYL